MQGNDGDDTIYGGTGSDDPLEGNAGEDTIYGQNGHDIMYGGTNNDTMLGGNGNDTMEGNAGDDQLHGGNANDTIDGNAGDDAIYGDWGDDTLRGGNNDDVLCETQEEAAPSSCPLWHIEGGGGTDKVFMARIALNTCGILSWSRPTGNDDVETARDAVFYWHGPNIDDVLDPLGTQESTSTPYAECSALFAL